MLKKQKEAKFRKILKHIKEIKIQGARNIAKAALYAFSLIKTKKAKIQLIRARPTEPMLVNTLKNFKKLGYKKTLQHFSSAQNKINQLAIKIIKNNSIIFTHCHSTNVINTLIYAKKQGKKFQVYNTETRPLYQGRITTKELKQAGIKVTTFIDSAIKIALLQARKTKGKDFVFLGADAILKNGIINKVGSGIIAEIAYNNKIPVYIIADSWKFASKVKLEERNFKEVWKHVPKNIKIKNPAFEFVPARYIKAIVSEWGILSSREFARKVQN